MIKFDQAQLGFFGGQNWLMLRVLPECKAQVQTFLENKLEAVYQAELKRFRPRRPGRPGDQTTNLGYDAKPWTMAPAAPAAGTKEQMTIKQNTGYGCRAGPTQRPDVQID